MKFKPMLADDANLKTLRYPVIASPKMDGVRATFVEGKLLSRNLKAPGNRALQQIECDYMLDGELIVGDPTSKSCFRDTMSIFSAHDADIRDVKFYVFDLVGPQAFRQRLQAAFLAAEDEPFMIKVPHLLIEDEKSLLSYEELTVQAGYEGLMLRDPTGGYKFGRSTVNEGLLLKLKRRMTSEAEVIGFIEQMHNANELKTDNLGYAERSSHQANMIPMNTLGALAVKDIHTGVMFNVGTGFTAQDRAEIWAKRKEYLGSIVSYEFLPVGVKDKPRHPVWLGFRDRIDL